MTLRGGDELVADVMAPIEAFYRVYNEGVYDLWNDALAEHYTAEVNGHHIPDRDVGLGFVKTFREAFPDLHYTVDEAIVAGDRVTTRWTATGTHQGVFFGNQPSHVSVHMLGITVFQVEGGEIVKLWSVWDLAGLLGQLESG